MLAPNGAIMETNISDTDIITKNNISNYAIPKLQSPVGDKIVLSMSMMVRLNNLLILI